MKIETLHEVVARTITGAPTLRRVLAPLVEGCLVTSVPLPDDEYTILVEPENAHVLDEAITAAKLMSTADPLYDVTETYQRDERDKDRFVQLRASEVLAQFPWLAEFEAQLRDVRTFFRFEMSRSGYELLISLAISQYEDIAN